MTAPVWSEEAAEVLAELMTDAEKALVEKLGSLMADFLALAPDPIQQGNDQFEVMLHVHGLQNIVLAQAACRAYGYRAFGVTNQQADPPRLPGTGVSES